MEWKDIAGAVGKAAPVVGTILGGPLGGAVGGLVASVLGVEATPDKVSAAIEADPRASVKLRQLEMEHARALQRMLLESETARLAEINATMRAEVASCDPFVRRWRPFFGYVVSLTWAIQFGAIAWSMVAAPQYAAELVNAAVALTPMWGIALAVLGVNVMKRSQDKAVEAGQAPATLGGVLAGMAGGKRH